MKLGVKSVFFKEKVVFDAQQNKKFYKSLRVT